MSTTFSIGQMNQLADALERGGYTPDDVTKLGQSACLPDIKGLLYGLADLIIVKHIVDCDSDPYIPDGWEVESHSKGGQFELDPKKVQLYLSEAQKPGEGIEGNKLRKELKSQPVLNANVLDYYLKHPDLIPEEWKGKYVFFWGTIYRRSDGDLYVRFLYFNDGSWRWGSRWLGDNFHSGGPAAVAGK